jgi:hypothetical protein
MPNRIIREAILSSEKMALLAWPEEVFYRRLQSIVDDFGRYEANPQLLRARCYPLQTDAVRVTDISRWMAACQTAGLILNYAVQGKQYLEVLNFGQQQRSTSKYPGPESADSTCNHLPADAHLGVSVSGVVSEDDKPAAPSGAELFEKQFWPAYPKKKAKDDALKAFLKRKPDQALVNLILKALAWQALTEDWVKEGGKFIPYPATWLNDGRWTDEQPKAMPAGAVPTVPSKQERDPELIRREQDSRNAAAPSAETLERIARIKQGATSCQP